MRHFKAFRCTDKIVGEMKARGDDFSKMVRLCLERYFTILAEARKVLASQLTETDLKRIIADPATELPKYSLLAAIALQDALERYHRAKQAGFEPKPKDLLK